MGAGQLIVEIVAVGTELLLGQFVNTNGTEIARRLTDEGFDTHHQTVVGDNLERIVDVLRTACARADAVVITGGVGPTQDDLTREALCELSGRSLNRDVGHAQWIGERVRSRGSEPAENVYRMADIPEGATPLPNPTGVALGVALEHEGTLLFALPGVPREMIPMLSTEVIPRLRRAAGAAAAIHSRVLRCWGLGESAIADRLDDLFGSTNPTIAFLIKDMEVLVRMTAKAATAPEAVSLIAPVEAEIRARLGDVVFGVDEDAVEEIAVSRLRRAGWTVSTTERATQGNVGARLASADAGNTVFAGTCVPGRAATSPFPADVTIDVGAAGPDEAEGARTTRAVEITVVTPLTRLSRSFELGGDDEAVRTFATLAGLHMLRLALSDGSPE